MAIYANAWGLQKRTWTKPSGETSSAWWKKSELIDQYSLNVLTQVTTLRLLTHWNSCYYFAFATTLKLRLLFCAVICTFLTQIVTFARHKLDLPNLSALHCHTKFDAQTFVWIFGELHSFFHSRSFLQWRNYLIVGPSRLSPSDYAWRPLERLCKTRAT